MTFGGCVFRLSDGVSVCLIGVGVLWLCRVSEGHCVDVFGSEIEWETGTGR